MPEEDELRLAVPPFFDDEAFFLAPPEGLLFEPDDLAAVFDLAFEEAAFAFLPDFLDDEALELLFFPAALLEPLLAEDLLLFVFAEVFFNPAEDFDDDFLPLLLEVDLADELLPPLLLAGDFPPPEDMPPGETLSAPVASTAELAAPTTAPDAAPLKISPTTSFVLSAIFANVPFFFAIGSPFYVDHWSVMLCMDRLVVDTQLFVLQRTFARGT